MADFGGEYLTVDEAVYFSGEDPRLMHNKYSEMWAKLNREALEEEGKVESTFLFFRSGYIVEIFVLNNYVLNFFIYIK